MVDVPLPRVLVPVRLAPRAREEEDVGMPARRADPSPFLSPEEPVQPFSGHDVARSEREFPVLRHPGSPRRTGFREVDKTMADGVPPGRNRLSATVPLIRETLNPRALPPAIRDLKFYSDARMRAVREALEPSTTFASRADGLVSFMD